jgi:hypothetical protein
MFLLPIDAGNGGEEDSGAEGRPLLGGGEVLTEGPNDSRWGERLTFDLGA